ncbi:MAG: ABC transporter permease subunit [Magnetovibrio sp.]|nr:ABC transporter permease subunit [Magnetovibrio sp.]
MERISTTNAVRHIIVQSSVCLYREKTVVLLSGLFVVLVLVSAYLGWSATSTVNSIYADAVIYLQSSGQQVPPNPVQELSPLSLMRNMSIYVSLIGVLASIVIGYQLIASDRKSGILPLLGARPIERRAYVFGKILALMAVNGGLLIMAAAVSVVTFLILPNVVLNSIGWIKLFSFFILSYGYMVLFGLLAIAAAASSRSESVGLLLPVTIWLAITFILPSLTGNIHPTASINPISALASPPNSTFFHWTGWLVGPFSISESFKYLSADLLDFLPTSAVVHSIVPPLPDLILAFVGAGTLAIRAMLRMDMTRGDFDV